MKRNQKGFTLMEMLIVVAIIAVLVAVAIPVYTAQMHKARVAADKANVRAYYAEIQADYMLTEKHNNKVPQSVVTPGSDWTKIVFLNGTEVKLQAGLCIVAHLETGGYNVHYFCNAGHEKCELNLG